MKLDKNHPTSEKEDVNVLIKNLSIIDDRSNDDKVTERPLVRSFTLLIPQNATSYQSRTTSLDENQCEQINLKSENEQLKILLEKQWRTRQNKPQADESL
jgi:hypothetical protein